MAMHTDSALYAHFVLTSTPLQLIPALHLESRISMMESFSERA